MSFEGFLKAVVFFLSFSAFVLATWTLSIWLSPNQLCLNSDIVEATYVINSSGTQTIPDCGMTSQLIQPVLPAENQQLVKVLIESIQRVENFVNVLPFEWDPITVQVDLLNPLVISNEKKMVIVGAGLLQTKGASEKVIIRTLLESQKIFKDRFLLEIATDYFSYFIRNSSDEFDAITGEKVHHNSAHWISYIQTFRQYCLSNLKSLAHFSYCVQQNNLASQGSKAYSEITIWGFRSYFSQHLWRMHLKVGLNSRLQFFQKIMGNLRVSSVDVPDSIEDIEKLSEWIQLVGMSLVKEQKQFANLARESLAQSGLDQPLNFKWALKAQREYAESSHSLVGISKVLSSGRQFLIDLGSESLILPQNRRIPVSASSFQLEGIVLAGCGKKFQLKNIENVNSKKIVVIESCHEPIDWKRLLEKGALSFQKKNGKLFKINRSI